MSLKIGSLIFYEKLKPFFFVFSKFPVLRIQTRKEPKIFLVFSTPHSDPQLLPDPEFFNFFFLFFFQVSLIDFPKLTIVFLTVLDIFTKMYFFFFRLEWLIMSMRSVCPSQNPENQCLTKNCRAGFIC